MTEAECIAAGLLPGGLSPGTVKYGRVTSERSEDYAKGIASPLKDWRTQCLAAEPNYKAGIAGSVAAGRYARGLNQSSTFEQQ